MEKPHRKARRKREIRTRAADASSEKSFCDQTRKTPFVARSAAMSSRNPHKMRESADAVKILCQ
jgi:hypothetical protein